MPIRVEGWLATSQGDLFAAEFGQLVSDRQRLIKGELLFALVASVLVLPSMLVVWDRWHRRRGEDVVDQAAYERAHAGL